MKARTWEDLRDNPIVGDKLIRTDTDDYWTVRYTGDAIVRIEHCSGIPYLYSREHWHNLVNRTFSSSKKVEPVQPQPAPPQKPPMYGVGLPEGDGNHVRLFHTRDEALKFVDEKLKRAEKNGGLTVALRLFECRPVSLIKREVTATLKETPA